jgi:hypothetical protein
MYLKSCHLKQTFPKLNTPQANSNYPFLFFKDMTSDYWSPPSICAPDAEYLTENLDPTVLRPETPYRRKFLISASLVLAGARNGPYLFFQILSDKSPSGTRSLLYCL